MLPDRAGQAGRAEILRCAGSRFDNRDRRAGMSIRVQVPGLAAFTVFVIPCIM